MRFSSVFFIIGVALFHGCVEAADGAKLFGVSDIVSKEKESTSLSSGQQKALRHFRRLTDLHKNIMAVRLNRAALDSSLLTLITPEGKEVQYVGGHKKLEHQDSYAWTGKSKFGTLGIFYSDNSLVGEIREDGKVYNIMALDNLVYIISEVPYNDFSEPPSMSGGVDPPELRRAKGLSAKEKFGTE